MPIPITTSSLPYTELMAAIKESLKKKTYIYFSAYRLIKTSARSYKGSPSRLKSLMNNHRITYWKNTRSIKYAHQHVLYSYSNEICKEFIKQKIKLELPLRNFCYHKLSEFFISKHVMVDDAFMCKLQFAICTVSSTLK